MDSALTTTSTISAGRIRRFLILCFVLAATGAVLPGTLLSVTPTGASPGVLINVTGTGFSTTAAQNVVTFTPSDGGDATSTPATSVATIDPAKGVRRLVVRVPADLPAGTTGLTVVNTATGEASNLGSLEVVRIALDRQSAAPGAQGVAIRITGSANATFVAPTTRPAFGAGITVVGTIVESPTSLVTTINIAPAAALGPRSVSITSSTQSLLLSDGFEVATAPPANHAPTANANGPYSGMVNEPVSLSSGGSTDPDGDTLTYLWTFGDGGTSSDPNPSHAYTASGQFAVTLTVSDGKGGSHTASTTAQIVQPNRPPQFTSSPVIEASEGEPYAYQLSASDPDADALTFSLVAGPSGLTVTPGGLVAWTPTGTDVGRRDVQVQVSDGRGGVDTQTFAIVVAAAVRLTGIDVTPSTLHFTELGASSQLTVTGLRSNQSTVDLTTAATGTTYESSNPAAATVTADGLVAAAANGTTTITARNGGFSDTASVVVELGPALESIDLTPAIITLRSLSATAATTVRGSFSDGSIRDLTNAPGTTFTVDPGTIASVNANGAVQALQAGTATLTASHLGHSASAQIRVELTPGTAFLRGEVFDDSRGIPLGNATATVLPVGGAGAAAPSAWSADERGRFVVPSGVGATVVQIERSGFTSVDRVAAAADNAVTTLLDARLTPLDGRLNLLQSVFGGQALSSDGTATLTIPPGSLDADTTLRVTPISNQGLQGLLPIGWSPIAAVDIQPAGRLLSQAATLRLPHSDTLPAGTAVAVVRYDSVARRWVVQATGQVSSDRRTLSADIGQTGQFAFVVPDDAPFSPPAAITGEPLIGLAVPTVPANSTVSGTVIPRSAPPGSDARAVGTIVLQPGTALPSGAVLRARVQEQFDLLDATHVRPLPFVQDVVLFARPRLGTAGTLATRLPITPTLQFSIQQLSLGQVTLDVTIDEPVVQSAIVGGGGGSLTDAAGDALDVPAGALPNDVPVGLLPIAPGQISIGIPDGFSLLGSVLIELVGTSFGQPAFLSITRPSSLDPSRQIVVAQVITDPAGGRRLKIVGLGAVDGTRIGVQTTAGGLTFDGVRTGGEYLFLQPQAPIGFVAGVVNSPAAAPQALALVTTSTAPFASVTGPAGTFVVAGRTGTTTTVNGLDPAGALAAASTSLTSANQVASLTLTLAVIAPSVTTVSPGANATNVALDSSVVIDFSRPIDPASVVATSAVLRTGQTVVAAQIAISANRRRVTISPSSPLAGLTTYTLTLTADIRDAAGNALAPFTPASFTTLDPSKPAALALGRVSAELPDEDGLSLITGSPGAADPRSAVIVTNLRTQTTTTVPAAADGSFRLRIPVVLGDELALTFHDPGGRETTLSLTQFSSTDGTTAIGSSGGTVSGASGRIGRILPRALSSAGVFRLREPDGTAPVLPSPLHLADRFALTIDGAAFRRLDSLTLTESQGRFAPETVLASPFSATVQLTVPPDFLVSASLRFTAMVADRDGTRRSANAATVVVGNSPDRSGIETGFGDAFPTVFLSTPKQAVPSEVVRVSAVAPTARVDFDLPGSPALQANDTIVLGRVTTVGGEAKLVVVDRLSTSTVGGVTRMVTNGRGFPGAARGGDYAVIGGAIAFVTGRANGPTAVVSISGWPLIAETDGANGAFVMAVPAGAPFTLQVSDAITGAPLGTVAGQAPASGGSIDVGHPVTPAAGTLTLTAEPGPQSLTDIGSPIVFTFSAPLDRSSVTTAAFVITEESGARVFGTIGVSDDGRRVTFVPFRRWRFGMRYRYGVATTVTAASGARMSQPFAGEFSTFAPRVIRNIAVGTTNDVAVAGPLAAVATETGVATVDVASIGGATIRSQLPLAGGSRGVALLPGTSFTDRNGQLRAGTFAAVATGNPAGTGRLEVVDVTGATALSIGSAQLTTPAGQTSPAGVPPASGTPNAITFTGDKRALVSIVGVGLTAVDVAGAVPADPAAPARSVVARFPAGTESVSGSAELNGRIVTAGAAGLSVLEAVTLQRKAVVSTTGDAAAVATLPAFAADLNGDGVIATDERFDLAAVANGLDGTLQFYRVPDLGTPTLLSAVRFAEAAVGVTLDAAERLAYVSVGSRGVAVVDLDGPASVQPLDDNHDGIDDRILGLIDTPGFARRTALALDRGLGFVADGVSGLSVLQLLPSRTRFLTLQRDPFATQTGDEESVGPGLPARTTDDAVRVSVAAVIPEQSALFLTIAEEPDGAGPLRLSFADGSRRAPLTAGITTLSLPLSRAAGATGSNVELVVVTASSAVVAKTAFRIEGDSLAPQSVDALLVAPSLLLGDEDSVFQLVVGGRLRDGRIVNLTSAGTGTTYQSTNPLVVDVTLDGLLVVRAGGTANIVVTNGDQLAVVSVTVRRPPVVQAVQINQPFMTLVRVGERQSIDGFAELTDGSREPLVEAGVTFESSAPGVVTVDAVGGVTAVGAGQAVVTVRIGTLSAQIRVAVEPRTAAVLTGIDLASIAAPVLTTDPRVELRATVSGTGSLEGIAVQFAIPGGTTATGVTDYDGVAIGLLRGLTAPGVFQVTATVINPSGGNALTDTAPLSVTAAGTDAEPNDTTAGATPVRKDVPVSGALGGGDLKDVYRTESRTLGTLSVELSVPAGTNLSQIRVVMLDGGGAELARFTPSAETQRFRQTVASGATFVSIESLGAGFTYTATTQFAQGPLTIASVTPLTGGPGTTVTIGGAGFSTDPEDVRVLFGGIPGRVVSSTPTEIQVMVPAAGKDGAITVITTARRAVGPSFTVGNTAPRAPITIAPTNPDAVRFEPVTKQAIDVTRVVVFADALTSRPAIDALAQSLGGTVVGDNVVLGSYVLEFTANQTLAGLAALQRQIAASPLVRYTTLVTFEEPIAIRIDLRDSGVKIGGIKAGVAFAQAQIFAAIEAIRNSPEYSQTGATFQPVNLAVIDSGFAPAIASDFLTPDGQKIVRLFRRNVNNVFQDDGTYVDFDTKFNGHGTAVTSVIAALNNGGSSSMSGGYGGLFRRGEANFQVSVYAPYDPFTNTFVDVYGAIAEIADRGDIDILNMSLGHTWDATGSAFNATRTAYKDAFALLGGKTLVVIAAGNDASDASLATPAVVAQDLPYVMAIGATAVVNRDSTGEGPDSRANFSNYGDAVTLAAPGEDVYGATTNSHPNAPFTMWPGTSFAAPIVSAVAALVQAIRPAGDPLDPDLVRTMLVDSADELPNSSTTWQRTVPLRRVDALNAVRLLLPPSDPQMIYVADGDADGNGHIIGIDIDPLTGLRYTPPNPDRVIPLTVTKTAADGSSVTVEGKKPTTLLVAPTGDELFAMVDSDEFGASLLVVSTVSNAPADFIPLSGAGFPAEGSGAALAVSSLKPPMVFSKDGRVLYVGAGRGLVVVNAVTHRVVKVGIDLPGEYNGLPSATPDLAARLGAIEQAIAAGVPTSSGLRPGLFLSGLALSPDGRVLYAAVSTGGGAGQQPGGLLAINVDLYSDAAPQTGGLQTDLTHYLELITPQAIAQVGAGGFLGGDEPQGVGVAADGKSVYLVNGGLNFFESVPVDQLQLVKYQDLLLGPALTLTGAAGGVQGVASAISSFGNEATQLSEALRRDLELQAGTGITFIGAPGVTGVFDIPVFGPSIPSPSWVFPSDVGFGWNPTADNGGSVINHTRFHEVFAKRPFGFAPSPNGRRALIPMFQSGNFGIVDLDEQVGFQSPPGTSPKPGISSLSAGIFQGLVGVTEALRFDPTLWPRRGAFTSGSTFMPSPDENFMFPWHAEYAQNGKWAAAVHVGARAPGQFSAEVPDQTTATLLMTELSPAERDGQTPSPGQTFTATRGGGGLTIIDDFALITDIHTQRTQQVFSPDNNTQRPYLATLPACGPRAPTDNGTVRSGCTTQSVEYAPTGGATRFFRPRGVTIQPFLMIQAPRHGDHVSLSTAIQLAWRDTRIGAVAFRIFELPPPETGNPPIDLTGPITKTIAGQVRTQRFGGLTLEALLNGTNVQLVDGKRYRIDVRALQDDGTFFSQSPVDVVFEALGQAEPDPPSLTLSPFLVPAIVVPTGQPKQLTAVFEAANSNVEQNVTADGDITYLWIQGLDQDPPVFGSTSPALNLTMSLIGEEVKPFVEGIINDIKTKLSAGGVNVPFALGKVQVSANGQLTIQEAGINLVQAVYKKDGVLTFSNPIIVLAGLELTKIDLEPDSLLNTAAALSGAETLGKKIAGGLGKKVNTPLILTANPPAGFSFLEQTGGIELNDVVFTYLGQGTISMQDLMQALEKLITKQMRKAIIKRLPANPLVGGIALLAAPVVAKGIVSLIESGVGEAAIQFVDFKSSDTSVATVDNETGFSKGDVTARSPGIIAIKGELDLRGLGKANDKVPVLVLPQLTSAVMDPINIVFCRADSPEPGRKVRTLATAKFAPHITLDPAAFGASEDITEFLDAVLPHVLPVGQAFDIPVKVGDFEARFQGLVKVENDKIVWDNPALVFTVPNLPGVENRYEFTDNASMGRVAVPRELFSARILHQGVVGRSRITNFVTVPILGSVQAIGSITVTEVCNTPFLTKVLAGGSTTMVETGTSVSYTVTASNPTSNTLTNVSVIDTATFIASQPTGDPQLDAVDVEIVVPVGTLEPHTAVEVPVSIPTVSGFTGLLSNRATVTGDGSAFQNVTPCQVTPTQPQCPEPQPPRPTNDVPFCQQHPNDPRCTTRPKEVIVVPPPESGSPLPGGPLITEMVLTPQRDWNDSAGGNGVAFDAIPGNGTIDGNDVWIEVSALTALTNFTITLTDATGATFSRPIPPPPIFGGVQVVSGFGVGASPIVKVEVRDTAGFIRQSVDTTAVINALGLATGPADESLGWSIFGTPSPLLQQFLRRAATPGTFTGF